MQAIIAATGKLEKVSERELTDYRITIVGYNSLSHDITDEDLYRAIHTAREIIVIEKTTRTRRLQRT